MKTSAVKRKAATKIAKAKRKIARKCKGVSVIFAALSLLALFTGCATSDSAQPAKANTMSNTFDDCIIVIASKTSVSNKIVVAEGTEDTPAVEMFTQTQSLENSGTDSTTQTATQTPTTDVKPDIDIHYNDAINNATTASKGVLEELTELGKSAVLSMMAKKLTGSVEVEKKDGTKTTVDCKDGQCSFGGGCSDCTQNKDCANCTAK